jgi:hypothetical protein
MDEELASGFATPVETHWRTELSTEGEARNRVRKGLKLWFRTPPRRHGEVEYTREVSFLELFYDLVYVVVIGRAAHHLAARCDGFGGPRSGSGSSSCSSRRAALYGRSRGAASTAAEFGLSPNLSTDGITRTC